MSRPVDVLAVLDRAHVAFSGERAADIYAARAAVAELVDAAKAMRYVTGGGTVCTVTQSLVVYHRLDAALAKFEQ